MRGGSVPVDDRAIRADVDADTQWIDTRPALLQQVAHHGIRSDTWILHHACAVHDRPDLHRADVAAAARAILDRYPGFAWRDGDNLRGHDLQLPLGKRACDPRLHLRRHA